MAKYTGEERAQSLALLTSKSSYALVPGSRVTSIVVHHRNTAWSIMLLCVTQDGRIENISGHVARALGRTFDRVRGSVRASGGGMDMGFELVYELSKALFPQGGTFDGRTERPGYCLRHDRL